MRILFTLIALIGACFFCKGAPFRNLGFDEADISTTFGTGPASDLLPGWQVFEGTNVVARIGFNQFTDEENYVNLVSVGGLPFGAIQVDGLYALNISRGANYQGYILVQTGDVPIGAQLLSYKFYDDGFGIRANGEVLQPVGPFFLNSSQFGNASQRSATNYFDYL